MNKKPLLIGGAPRSGTTALIQLLNSNPSVFISSEENILKSIDVVNKTLSTKERRLVNLANGMREVSQRETINKDNIHSHNFTKSGTWPVIKYIYKWHHQQINPTSDLILWGDKLPNYFKEMDSIINSGKFQYLHITRNPLDVINSMLRRTEMAKQGKDWWKAITSFDEMLNTWTSAYCAIEKHEENDLVLHIHYEDLLFNYSNTIEKINFFTKSNLSYQNILISDKELHFDRAYLNDSLLEIITNNPVVSRYMNIRNLERKNHYR